MAQGYFDDILKDVSKAPESPKGQFGAFSAVMQDVPVPPPPEQPRTLLGNVGPSRGPEGVRGAIGIIEQIPAGVWGIGSMLGGAIAATINTGREKIRQLAEDYEKPSAYRGRSLGEIWTEEYRHAAENAHKMYVPFTPEGAALSEKMAQVVTDVATWVGDKTFTGAQVAQIGTKALNLPTPAIARSEAAAGAIGEAATILGSMAIPLGGRRPAVKPVPPKTPGEIWADFKTKYPETATRMESSGAVRMDDFVAGDTTAFDQVHRRLNKELGLKDEGAKIPLAAKVRESLRRASPNVPEAELSQATNSFMYQLAELDRLREARALERGLPPPRPEGESFIVTPSGTALTREQARAADRTFLDMPPDVRADAMGVSDVGRHRLALENIRALEASGDTAAATAARNRWKQDWAKSFPYRDPIKREAARDRFENFDGRMTWAEISEGMGDPISTTPKSRGITKAGPGTRQLGMIDIEGLAYTLRAFENLPDKEVLKRATILGAVQQQRVPKVERDLILEALGDRESIPQAELKGEIAAQILPLRPKNTLEYSTVGLGEIGIEPRALKDAHPPTVYAKGQAAIDSFPYRTTVWEMPIEGKSHHFSNPNYFAHTRSFDQKGTRSIIEVQSDYLQNLNRKPVADPIFNITPENVSIYREAVQAALEDNYNHPALQFVASEAAKRIPAWSIENLQRNATSNALLFQRLELEVAGALATAAPRPITQLKDTWFQRILLEENRRASQHGVRTMRMADANTVTKVEGWPVKGWNVKLADGEYYVSNTLPYPEGGPLITRIKTRPDGSTEIGERITDVVDRERITNELTDQISHGNAQPEFSIPDVVGIYNRYTTEFPAFLKKQFNAKHVVDEKGNGWWEWPVRADDAKKKIPAFLGKQKGALIFEGFEEAAQAMAKGKKAAEAAIEKSTSPGWQLGTLEQEKAAAAEVAAVFQKSFEAQEAGAVGLSAGLHRLKLGVFGHDLDVVTAMQNAGELGKRAHSHFVLQRGATDAARAEMQTINERIFDKLSRQDKRWVDELARAHRIVEIDSYKGVGKHTHVGNLTGPKAEAFIRNARRELGEAEFNRLFGFVRETHAVYKQLLVDRAREGLITAEDLDRLLHYDYTPTQFVDLIDPVITYNVRGQPISVRSSGVQDLGTGKVTPVTMDTQLLLAEALARTRNLQFKNRTLRSLYELGKTTPDNGFVKVAGEGKPGQPAPHGWTRLGVRVDGVQRELFMHSDLAEQFVRSPQSMDPWVANALRVGSLSSVLRASAVGYNPLFPLAGVPMDIAHLWLASGRIAKEVKPGVTVETPVYSTHLPMFLAQIAGDMVKVLPTVVKKGPEYQQAVREGIGLHFAADYGRHVFTRDKTLAERITPRYENVTKLLRGSNQEMDMLVRMAHRRRLIEQGVKSADATAMARDRLDYSQGGVLSKAVDTTIPWTNVSMQALYKVAREAKKNPGDFATKMAWTVGTTTATIMANMFSSPETWQSIPERDKISGQIITFGDQLFVEDPDGNRRYAYIVLRTDQTIAPIMALSVGLSEHAMYGKLPSKLVSETVKQWTTLYGTADLIPILNAATALRGFDAHTGRPIEDSPKTSATTSPIAKFLGEQTGIAPKRLEATAAAFISPNNPWVQAAGWGLKQLFDVEDPRANIETTEHLIASHLRPIVKLTNPLTKFMDGVDDVVKGVTKEQDAQRQAVDDLIFKVKSGQATREDITTYVNSQPPQDRERLMQRAQFGYVVDEVMKRFGAGKEPGVPPAAWWRVLNGAPDEARAMEFHNRWLSAGPEDRRRMERIAAVLQEQGTGFISDRFKLQLSKEREKLGTDHR